MSTAIEVQDVVKKFRIYHERNQSLKAAVMRRGRGSYEDFLALDGVSLEVPEASSFALIGDNGSGKSTLLKCMAKILFPESGNITMNGRVAALLEVGSGFHPELSGRDNIYLNGSILGMSRKEIERKFDEIVDFSGVEQFIDQPVKNYSSGMYVRLGFSVAINVEPEILLVDEVLAVGDAAFQEKCTEKFATFKREGRTVVLVSHSLPSVRAMADTAAWIDHGRLREIGPASGVLERYEDFTHASTSTTYGGLTHSGTGEIRIDSAEVVRADGRPGAVAVGEPGIVRLRYTATEAVTSPVIGFAFEATDGTYLGATNTRDAGQVLGVVKGSGTIECEIPSVTLHPGSYLVTAAVTDETTTHAIDHVRDITRFTVENGGRTWSGGYLAIPARWSAAVEVSEG
ncbi:ABC transporter ATP-binding protein [Cellulomonas soli]|uniref:ABC transporter ATP-binding protein n=1 Tax=Cellulomonas soli TaxID=931535 RepID=UPI001D4A3614|nr:ABC transporter ATP-binding protein [Cellulomonadaceae bacterium]